MLASRSKRLFTRHKLLYGLVVLVVALIISVQLAYPVLFLFSDSGGNKGKGGEAKGSKQYVKLRVDEPQTGFPASQPVTRRTPYSGNAQPHTLTPPSPPHPTASTAPVTEMPPLGNPRAVPVAQHPGIWNLNCEYCVQ
jgi:hypothetical protein